MESKDLISDQCSKILWLILYFFVQFSFFCQINYFYDRVCWLGYRTMEWDPWTWRIRKVSTQWFEGSSPHSPLSLMTTRSIKMWSCSNINNIEYLKARNPELFVDSGLESTSRLFSHDGSGNTCYILLCVCLFENTVTFLMKCTKLFVSNLLFVLTVLFALEVT